MDNWGKGIADIGNQICKGPEEQWGWNMMSEEEDEDRRQEHRVFHVLEMDHVEACRTLSRVLILFRVSGKTTGGLWAEK